MRIRDPGWKKVGSGIRDKHPGSATLLSSSSFLYCRHPQVAGLAAELSELQAKIQPAQREVENGRKKEFEPSFLSCRGR